MTEKKYIVTIPQLAKIVGYCVHMTIAGIGIRKDWPAQMVLPESVRLVTVTIEWAVSLWMGEPWFLVDD